MAVIIMVVTLEGIPRRLVIAITLPLIVSNNRLTSVVPSSGCSGGSPRLCSSKNVSNKTLVVRNCMFVTTNGG